MRRCVEPALLAAALAFCAPAVAGDGVLDEREAMRAGQSVIGQPVPDAVLLDREARPVRLSRYRGKPLLVSFIYTGCFQVCPAQTRALLEAVRGMDAVFGQDQFSVVSVGFNQPFDSPTAMRAFAAQHRIEYANWDFLSPPPAVAQQLTRAFGFSYRATPAGFDHVLGVTVVDADGRIHGQVYGDRLNAAQIGEPLRELLRAAPPPRGWQVGTLIERVRILCTVYDPDTGRYRYDYKLLFEIAGGVTFFVSVGIYGWRERRRNTAAKRHAPVG